LKRSINSFTKEVFIVVLASCFYRDPSFCAFQLHPVVSNSQCGCKQENKGIDQRQVARTTSINLVLGEKEFVVDHIKVSLFDLALIVGCLICIILIVLGVLIFGWYLDHRHH